MNIRTRLLIFLASKGSKCATLSEILAFLKPYYNGKNLRIYALKILSKMARRREIRRSWIRVRKKKFRLYCVRLGE
ncbi:hypothetical protein ATG_18680 [Desulfurococcaceae archaeon AG1]|nr:hypothetical protein ATG_18680 [Desulfurococcaceae archaeon AG1]